MKKIFRYDDDFGIVADIGYWETYPVIREEKDYINNIREIWEQLYAEQEKLDSCT